MLTNNEWKYLQGQSVSELRNVFEYLKEAGENAEIEYDPNEPSVVLTTGKFYYFLFHKLIEDIDNASRQGDSSLRESLQQALLLKYFED